MDETDDRDTDRPLNEFDDVLIRTTGVHGGDIASQRVDDLDRAALREALDRTDGFTALDLGCGLGAQGMRFSLLGGDVTLVDAMDIGDRIDLMDRLFEIGSLEFVQKDVRELRSSDLNGSYDIVYSQRFIHYLRYEAAVELLDLLAEHVADGGRIFLSASGLHTELGDGYPDRDTPLERRFSPLEDEMADKHGIHEPVCLYEKTDLECLLENAGFAVQDVFATGFGNVKAIAER